MQLIVADPTEVEAMNLKIPNDILKNIRQSETQKTNNSSESYFVKIYPPSEDPSSIDSWTKRSIQLFICLLVLLKNAENPSFY